MSDMETGLVLFFNAKSSARVWTWWNDSCRPWNQDWCVVWAMDRSGDWRPHESSFMAVLIAIFSYLIQKSFYSCRKCGVSGRSGRSPFCYGWLDRLPPRFARLQCTASRKIPLICKSQQSNDRGIPSRSSGNGNWENFRTNYSTNFSFSVVFRMLNAQMDMVILGDTMPGSAHYSRTSWSSTVAHHVASTRGVHSYQKTQGNSVCMTCIQMIFKLH